MTSDFQGILTSPIFHFLVGPDAVGFRVHSKLIAEHSSTLANLINGSFQESKNQQARLDDIDPKVFSRAVQFMYTGDYTVPEPEVDSTLEQEESEDLADGEVSLVGEKVAEYPTKDSAEEPAPLPALRSWPSHFEFDHLTPRSRKKKAKSGFQDWLDESDVTKDTSGESHQEIMGQLWNEFKDIRKLKSRSPWEPHTNKSSSEIYSEVFLCHAGLYVFADRYFMESLKALALDRLHITLKEFQLFKKRVPDVVDLIEYTYQNTRDHTEGIDELRNLVLAYAVCKIRSIAKDPKFQDMLKDRSALGCDVVMRITDSIVR